MAYTSALGADAERRGGSSPLPGTAGKIKRPFRLVIRIIRRKGRFIFPNDKDQFSLLRAPWNALCTSRNCLLVRCV